MQSMEADILEPTSLRGDCRENRLFESLRYGNCSSSQQVFLLDGTGCKHAYTINCQLGLHSPIVQWNLQAQTQVLMT